MYTEDLGSPTELGLVTNFRSYQRSVPTEPKRVLLAARPALQSLRLTTQNRDV
jgi:hypothetical protein